MKILGESMTCKLEVYLRYQERLIFIFVISSHYVKQELHETKNIKNPLDNFSSQRGDSKLI